MISKPRPSYFQSCSPCQWTVDTYGTWFSVLLALNRDSKDIKSWGCISEHCTYGLRSRALQCCVSQVTQGHDHWHDISGYSPETLLLETYSHRNFLWLRWLEELHLHFVWELNDDLNWLGSSFFLIQYRKKINSIWPSQAFKAYHLVTSIYLYNQLRGGIKIGWKDFFIQLNIRCLLSLT